MPRALLRCVRIETDACVGRDDIRRAPGEGGGKAGRQLDWDRVHAKRECGGNIPQAECGINFKDILSGILYIGHTSTYFCIQIPLYYLLIDI